MYGLGNNGGTPGGRLGGAFPDVVVTELRVEAVTVELLLRLRPRLLTLLRLDETLTTGGAADTVLEEVEKVLAEEWRLASLSTLVCRRVEVDVRPEDVDEDRLFCWVGNVLLSWAAVVLGSSSLWLRLLRAVECWLAVLSSDAADTPSLRGAMLGAEGESDFTAGPVAPSTACVLCNGVGCTELKPFLAWVRSFWGEEEMEFGYRLVWVDLCSYSGP